VTLARIKCTPKQAKAAQWAIDAMTDYLSDDDCDYPEAELPRVDGRTLVLPVLGWACIDLMYHIEEQLSDMAQAEGVGNRAGVALADKVREAMRADVDGAAVLAKHAADLRDIAGINAGGA
jgi:hypothetical protein